MNRKDPLPSEGLDKTLSLAIGARYVWPGSDVLRAKGNAELGECVGVVGTALVTHHLAALHALAVEPLHS